MKSERKDLVDKYNQILTQSPNLELLDVNSLIATKAAEFRVKYNLKTPDAIQVASASFTNAEAFLTNDIRLKRVEEFTVIVLKETV